jgi:hypothetical protein
LIVHLAGLDLEGLALADDGYLLAEPVWAAKSPEIGDEIVDFHLIPTPHLSHPKTQLLTQLQMKSAA